MKLSQAFAMTGCSINQHMILRITTIMASGWLFMQAGQISMGPRPAHASAPSGGILADPAAPDDLDANYKSINARSFPAGHCRVTDIELDAVQLGSHYADVVSMFGCAGTLASREIAGDVKFHLFAWNDGHVLTLFAKGRLLIASQSDTS
ncbi:hypothetical protein [Bradyrhizobium arachidis]|uniref:hypothetical protein n=1 Tax=Bradyrhizobium arachidis TaxID=858423 RepID=UPI002161EB07|nr:hypothetical protein [Bradyrhizobium arachidis]UVO30210.1 hypothetical protein KUF59_05460 [Bradyrhizobium arachidis]